MKIKETTRIIGFSLVFIVTEILFTGCASHSNLTWKTYSGLAPQGNALLCIDDGIYVVSVDGKSHHLVLPTHAKEMRKTASSVKYVRLLPGEHTITFGYWHSTNGYIFCSKSDCFQDIYVEAGKTYSATAYTWVTTNQIHKANWLSSGKVINNDWSVAITEDAKVEAQVWYKTATQGNAAAQDHLGWMYENGLGVTADREQAIQWYRKAANQGNKSAKKNLQRLGIQQ
jgi:hypothetical protein